MMRKSISVSAPAMFGRLPDQRDYVRWRVSADEAQILQAWLNEQTWLGQGRKRFLFQDDIDSEPENDGWIRLSPRETNVPEHHPLPWSFILSPGFLPVGGRNEWLTGALVASRDSTGRPWPLMVYQRVSQDWLEESLKETQGWLYCLTKLIASHISSGTSRDERLTDQTDRLWESWRPRPRWTGWLQGFRRKLPQQQVSIDFSDATLIDLPGVRHLPWPGWPEKIFMRSESQLPLGWCWQQNGEGRYIDALRLVAKDNYRDKDGK